MNPAAGGGRCGRSAPAALESLRAALEGAGQTLEVAYSGATGEPTRLAREAFGRGLRRFLAVGGDGTAFEVLNGLFPEAAREPRSVCSRCFRSAPAIRSFGTSRATVLRTAATP